MDTYERSLSLSASSMRLWRLCLLHGPSRRSCRIGWLPNPSERTAVEVDPQPRVGGCYRIVVIGPGDLPVTAGEYRDVVPGKGLVMTWSCGEPLVSYQDATTLITVDMRMLGAERTELTLVHAGVAPGDEQGLSEG